MLYNVKTGTFLVKEFSYRKSSVKVLIDQVFFQVQYEEYDKEAASDESLLVGFLS